MTSRILIPLAFFSVGLLGIVAVRSLSPRNSSALDNLEPAPEALPVFATVPEFTLTDESGREFGSRQLAGKIWVANFIFTRCPGTCPRQTMRMGQFQKQLAAQPGWDDVHLVSFSVDPEYDTPDVLKAYAEQAGAEPGRWHFLTGPRDEIWQLSKGGFKLDVGEAPSDFLSPLFHSPNLVVVDGQGRIRAYYDGTSEEGIQRVARAIPPLLNENP